jgi:hypothetical protein
MGLLEHLTPSLPCILFVPLYFLMTSDMHFVFSIDATADGNTASGPSYTCMALTWLILHRTCEPNA